MNETKPKKKQGKKAGKVVRLGEQTWKYINAKRRVNETIDSLIRRFAGLAPKGGTTVPRTFYVLPESGIVLTKCRSLAEARGTAITIATQKKKKLIEQPVVAREVV